MKKDSLTFGAKINCTFATIAAVLALAVWFGFHTAGSLSDSLESATGKTLRKIELAGILNTAESDMAVGQRGVVMFTYAKDSGQTTSAKQLFRTSSETFRKALVEIGPLLVTEGGNKSLRKWRQVLRCGCRATRNWSNWPMRVIRMEPPKCCWRRPSHSTWLSANTAASWLQSTTS